MECVRFVRLCIAKVYDNLLNRTISFENIQTTSERRTYNRILAISVFRREGIDSSFD